MTSRQQASALAEQQEGSFEILLLLVCVLGVITFFVLGLAYTTVLTEPQRHEAATKRLGELKQEEDDKKGELHLLEQELLSIVSLSETRERSQQVTELQNRRDDLQVEASILAAAYDRLVQEMVKLKDAFDQAEHSSSQRQEFSVGQLRQLLKRLSEEKTELKNAIAELKEIATYWGSGAAGGIHHIEVLGHGFRVHPEDKLHAFRDISSDPTLRLRLSRRPSLVLWIRPSATKIYREVETRFQDLNISISHEPLPKGKSIDDIVMGNGNE